MKALASRGSDTLDRRNSPGGRVKECLGYCHIATYCAAFRVDSAENLICNPTPNRRKELNAWHSYEAPISKLTCCSHDTDVDPLQAILVQTLQSLCPPGNVLHANYLKMTIWKLFLLWFFNPSLLSPHPFFLGTYYWVTESPCSAWCWLASSLQHPLVQQWQVRPVKGLDIWQVYHRFSVFVKPHVSSSRRLLSGLYPSDQTLASSR